MSDILIKGMEMPTEEYGSMTIKIYPNGHVAEYIGDMGRVWDAVPFPPHGDLIDRDKLEKDIDKYVGGEESRSRFHHWVQVQHTVIPKSEEA